jgi:restriction system protein
MAWMVRAGKYGEESHAAWHKSVVTLGWNNLPDFSNKNREEIRDLFEEYCPHYPDSWPNWVGQLFAFVKLIQISDLVVLPCKLEKSIVVGKIIGKYSYKDLGQDIIHYRRAEWLTPLIPRSELSHDTLKGLDSKLTVYHLNADVERVLEDLIVSHAKDEANKNDS